MSERKRRKRAGFFQIYRQEHAFRDMEMNQARAAKMGCEPSQRPVEHETVWATDHPAAGPLLDELIDALVYAKCNIQRAEDAALQGVTTLRSVMQKSEAQNFQSCAGASMKSVALDPDHMKSVLQSMQKKQEQSGSPAGAADREGVEKALMMLEAVSKEKRATNVEEIEQILKMLEQNVSLSADGIKQMFDNLIKDKTLTEAEANELQDQMMTKALDGKVPMVEIRKILKEFTTKKKPT
uniref:EF-hand domain-containing protein n=1 Tax=Trichuris muris TaxID=70415 RepID=A0A5S6QDK8_TRIMR